MGVALQLRRGTTAEVSSFSTGIEGELILDTETRILYVIDASGVKHPISGGGGGGTGSGGTDWDDMPVYDDEDNTITITNQDGTTTVIAVTTPTLDSADVNVLITAAIAAIPDASGLTITDLDALRAELIGKIDVDNEVQDQTIAAVSSIVDGNNQSIAVLAASATATSEEIAASVTADLYAQIGTNAAGLQSEQNVRALADLVIGQDVTNITTAFQENQTVVNTQLTAHSTADYAHSQAITALQSTTGGLTGSVASLAADFNTLTTNTNAVATTVTSLGSDVGGIQANLTTLSQTVADANTTALSETVTALSTTVGNNTTQLTTTTASVDGISGKHAIVINANGNVTGFEMLGGGGTGETIKFTTDNFVISGSGAADKAPFTVSNGNVGINGDLIATGTITSDQLSANAVSTAMINSVDIGNGMSFSLGDSANFGSGIAPAAAVFGTSHVDKMALIATGTETGAGFTSGFGAIGARAALGAIIQHTSYEAELPDRKCTFIGTNGGVTWETEIDGVMVQGGGESFGSVSYISNLDNTSMWGGATTGGGLSGTQCVTYLALHIPSTGEIYGIHSAGDAYIGGGAYIAGGVSPFTGCHKGLLDKSYSPVEGDILVDGGVAIKGDISNTITELTSSSSANQKGVVGVFTNRAPLTTKLFPEVLGGDVSYIEGDELSPQSRVQDIAPEYAHYIDTHDSISMNSLGEGQVNVCGEGGNLEIGDLIVTSSIAGKGKKQGDDIIRATTVAKVRENVTFSTYSEVKQVACIYLCG